MNGTPPPRSIRSRWQTPHASTSTRTWLPCGSPGSGSSSTTIGTSRSIASMRIRITDEVDHGRSDGDKHLLEEHGPLRPDVRRARTIAHEPQAGVGGRALEPVTGHGVRRDAAEPFAQAQHEAAEA